MRFPRSPRTTRRLAAVVLTVVVPVLLVTTTSFAAPRILRPKHRATATRTVRTTRPVVTPASQSTRLPAGPSPSSAPSNDPIRESSAGLPVADITAPPRPSFESTPGHPFTSTTAVFELSDEEAGVAFGCRLDGGVRAPCGPTVTYTDLAVADHCLAVVAVDAAGNVSPENTWCWGVKPLSTFPVTATIEPYFVPGATRPVNLVITNSYEFPIRVTTVAITVGETTTRPGCSGSANLVVTRPFTGPVDVPAGSTRSLKELGVPLAQWPTLTMPNLSTNQDACKRAMFLITYHGEAVRA